MKECLVLSYVSPSRLHFNNVMCNTHPLNAPAAAPAEAPAQLTNITACLNWPEFNPILSRLVVTHPLRGGWGAVMGVDDAKEPRL
eukprot:4608241-Pyramimonas_sp.AAC.2